MMPTSGGGPPTQNTQTHFQCLNACGDGLKSESEECDDGNLRDGDGCSSNCKVENGFSC